MTYHEYPGMASLLIGLIGSGIYIMSILKGRTRPHIYTHLVWAILTIIAFCAQIHDNAGPGAWAIGLTALATITQTILALKYGDHQSITRSDKIALTASLFAIIPWCLSNNPLGSVILICLIDAVGFYPTVRKSWFKPWEESLTAYNIASVKFGLSLVALTNFTIVTSLYTITIIAMNVGFTAMCLYRRRNLPKPAPTIK